MLIEVAPLLVGLPAVVAIAYLWYSREKKADELRTAQARLTMQPREEFVRLVEVPDNAYTNPDDWNPEKLAERGWERNFSDAAVMSPHFEVVRRISHIQSPGGKTPVTYYEYLILCPTFLRKPIYIMSHLPIVLAY